MSERVRERKVERRPPEAVAFGPPSRLVRGLAVALESVPSVYEKDVEKGAKIALALIMYYDPVTDSWRPATSVAGATEVNVKAYKPDTNTYEYLRLDEYGNLLTALGGAKVAPGVDIQYRRKEAFTCFSGIVTASGSSADVDVDHFSALELQLKVTGVSGTNPTLSVYIEGKFEGTGDYKPLVYQENITTTGIWHFTVSLLAFRRLRVRWVVGGTSPSFTFRVDAQAVV